MKIIKESFMFNCDGVGGENDGGSSVVNELKPVSI